MRCAAHTLQLCLKNAVKKCRMLNNAVEKLAAIVNSVHHSTQLTEAVMKDFSRTFPARNSTRWNSNFKMCKAAMQYDWANSSLPPEYRLSGANVETLKEFVGLLGLLEEAFQILQRKEYPVISTVIPAVFGLLRKLEVRTNTILSSFLL